ncbi:MAG: hypothetical protein N2578_02380 [Bdellovibrionaceae bacterium]|nr:hypothetical protein [Pseudobdellovibrionaceae bacterium]
MKIFLATLFLFFSQLAVAQAPRVGREAAASYFERQPASGASRFLGLHLGRYISGQAWEWGASGLREDGVGNYTLGVTYRLDEWNDSIDQSIRVDFNEYEVAADKPFKMSVLGLWTFPNANSRFPLYFGGAAGFGVYFKQLKDKSPLSIDYQLLMGARFFDVFGNGGFFIETGLKNHLHILSQGQFNGTFLSAGGLFTF